MPGTTISNSVSSTVTVGNSNYPNPVTVTTTGTIAPTNPGAIAVEFAFGNNLTFDNLGIVLGATGAAGLSGGDGLELFPNVVGDTITNTGTIAGGAGGAASSTDAAGDGGTGAYLRYGALTNNGSIFGGDGGSGSDSHSGVRAGYGVQAYNAIVSNNGFILGGYAAAQGNDGVRMLHNSSLLNGGTGTIVGGATGSGPNGAGDGVYQVTGTLTNQGTLIGGDNVAGVRSGIDDGFRAGDGLLISRANDTNSGTIIGGNAYGYGGYGVDFAFSGGALNTLNNSGVIIGGNGLGTSNPLAYPHYGVGGSGVDMRNGGVLTDSGTITGGTGNYRGGYGVLVGSGGTVITSGTIIGGEVTGSGRNDAIELAFRGGTVVVDPGAVFIGNVVAYGTGDFLLEFAGNTHGTLGGIGSQFQNFQDISFATGALWTVEGDEAGLATSQTITGFTLGDKLILDDFTESGFSYGDDALTLTGSGGAETIGIQGDFSTSSFLVVNEGGNTEILLCYLRGTKILTPNGEISIETLQAGDHVMTAAGRAISVIWAGSWQADLDGAPVKQNLLPVRIAAGALAEGVPHRDLHVSPDHGIYLGGALIPARLLINGLSITQPNRAGMVEYFHIQVEPHDILVAEGAAAESFLDLGHTSFTKPGEEPRSWEDACAPLLLAGPELALIREQLAERCSLVTA